MSRRILARTSALLTAGMACSPQPGRGADEEAMPFPSYPASAWAKAEGGELRLHVVFDANGWVKACPVAKSSGFTDLDGYTVDFVRQNWHSKNSQGRMSSCPSFTARWLG